MKSKNLAELAIREIEVFDKNGKKIQIKDAKASCEWCNSDKTGLYSNPFPTYTVGVKGVFDNNWGTVWNAGAADRSLEYDYNNQTYKEVYRGWIKVDLGDVYEIGKIRILIMGYSPEREMAKIDDKMYSNQVPRKDKIYVSIDDRDYNLICELKASYENPLLERGPDGDWIECSL